VAANTTWRPFGIADEDEVDGVRIVNLKLRGKDEGERDRADVWLRNAMLALGVLALAAAVVSFAAQFQLVYTAKHVRFAALLEAGIPDVGAAVFACLGIAMALQGRRASRCRALNLVCVGLSVTMNALGAGHGWRDLAVWVMPAAVYALASDTLIGVVRARVMARQRGEDDGETTPLAVLGGLALWTLRLILAPPSTLGGFRRWVVTECPAAPQARALTRAQAAAELEAASAAEARSDLAEAEAEIGRLETEAAEAGERVRAAESERDQAEAAAQRYADTAGQAVSARDAASREITRLRGELERERRAAAALLARQRDEHERELARARRERPAAASSPRPDTKTARFLALVEQRHGGLAGIEPSDTARIAGEIAPLVELNCGSARTALSTAVKAAREADRSAA
jgi:hypothetical protein